MKVEEGTTNTAIPQSQHAGLVAPQTWQTAYSGSSWLLKSSPLKGVQPVRPLIVMTQTVTEPTQMAIELK